MSDVRDILEKMHQGLFPYSGEQVAKAFMDKLGELDLDGSPVSVESADVGIDGNVHVVFSDEEGDAVEIAFGVDDDETYALVVSDDDTPIELDLDPLDPPLVAGMFEIFIELTNLDWMTPATLISLLAAGDVGEDDVEQQDSTERIPFATSFTPEESMFIKTEKGYVLDMDKIDEAMHLRKTGRKKVVIRGGKKVKLPIMKRTRKIRLSPKRKMALKKARRKAQMPAAKRKRAKSLKIRKRMNIKTTKLKRGERITR